MSSNAPLLFDLQIDDWKSLAAICTTPALALALVYLLGVDLLKIPFVATDVPYKIPRRLLVVCAISLCFIAAAANSVWLTLRLYPGPRPDIASFTESFFRPLYREEIEWVRGIQSGQIQDAELGIQTYDNVTDLRIFVNNNRVFGSYRDCAWIFQCKRDDESEVRERLLPLIFDDKNRWFPFVLNRLPLQPISLRPYLLPGLNFIDVFSNNSGREKTCNVEFSITFTMVSGKKVQHDFKITDDPSKSKIYRTISEDSAFRACDQFRLPIEIRQ